MSEEIPEASVVNQKAGIHFEDDEHGNLTCKVWFEPQVDVQNPPESQSVYATMTLMKYLESLTQKPDAANQEPNHHQA